MSDAGRYRKLYPKLWRHPGFRAMAQEVRPLPLYALSGPQTNGIGLFHFSVAMAAEDLDLKPGTVRKGLVAVEAAFGWQFDEEARVLFIPSWWRFNKPENPSVLLGNLKVLSEVPPCRLVDAFVENTETLPEPLRAAFLEGCRTRLATRPLTREVTRAPHQEQEQDQDQDQENNAARSIERAHAEKAMVDAFERSFWPAYPKHVAKKAAMRAYLKLGPDGALLDRMLAALKQQKPADIKFFPNASTWLNGERWND